MIVGVAGGMFEGTSYREGLTDEATIVDLREAGKDKLFKQKGIRAKIRSAQKEAAHAIQQLEAVDKIHRAYASDAEITEINNQKATIAAAHKLAWVTLQEANILQTMKDKGEDKAKAIKMQSHIDVITDSTEFGQGDIHPAIMAGAEIVRSAT